MKGVRYTEQQILDILGQGDAGASGAVGYGLYVRPAGIRSAAHKSLP